MSATGIPWATIPTNATTGQLCFAGNFAYAYTTPPYRSIRKYDLNGTLLDGNWYTDSLAFGLATDGVSLYASSNQNYILKINLTTKATTVINTNPSTTLGAQQILFYNNFLYIASIYGLVGTPYRQCIKMDPVTGATTIIQSTTNSTSYITISLDGNNLYVISGIGIVNIYSLANDSLLSTTTLSIGSPAGSGIYNNFMYTSNSGRIRQVSLATNPITVSNASWATTDLSRNTFITINNSYMYVNNLGNGNILQYTLGSPIPCFLEGSLILTEHGYKQIQNLHVGDKIVTYRHGLKPLQAIASCSIHNPSLSDTERKQNRLYRLSADKYPEVTEGDLILTGGHSLLVDSEVEKVKSAVDSMLPEEEKKATVFHALDMVSVSDTHRQIDGKHMLLACEDERADLFEREGQYTVWHIALEGPNEHTNYGIYANGLLVEAATYHFIKNNALLVEKKEKKD